MKILNLSMGQDVGGQQYRLARAWRRHAPEDEYLSVTGKYTFYPIEHWLEKPMLKQWWEWADVVHFHQDLRRLTKYPRLLRMNKPLLVHYHGSLFRKQPGVYLRTARRMRATQLVSTLDLHAVDPKNTLWLPQSYEKEELAHYADPSDDGVLKIAHAPTDRLTKGTDYLIAAVEKMKREGKKVSLDVIEGVDNEECMRRKGRADVYVDQLYLGYGNNALEAWGMGIPVLTGMDRVARQRIGQAVPDDTREMMLSTWGSLPWKDVTESTLYDALNEMLDENERDYWAKIGWQHFLRFHEAKAVVDRLRPIYQRVRAT